MFWHAVSQAALELQGDKILSFRLLRVCGSHLGITLLFHTICCSMQSSCCKQTAHPKNGTSDLKGVAAAGWFFKRTQLKMADINETSSVLVRLLTDFLNVNRSLSLFVQLQPQIKTFFKKYFKKSSSVVSVMIHFFENFLPDALCVSSTTCILSVITLLNISKSGLWQLHFQLCCCSTIYKNTIVMIPLNENAFTIPQEQVCL